MPYRVPAILALLLFIVILPSPAQSWRPTAGPPGRIRAIIEHAGAIYAGGEFGRLFRSTDGGESWTRSDQGLAEAPITAMTSSGGAIYAGTHGGFLYRSTDGGESWTDTRTSSIGDVSGIVVNGSTIIVGINGVAQDYPGKVRRSTDGGTTWEEVYSGVHVTGVGMLGSDLFMTTEWEGHYRSSDNGATWKRVVNSGGYLNALTIDHGVIYSGQSSMLLRSVDSGVSWSKAGDGIKGIIRSIAVRGDTLLVSATLDVDGAGGVFRSVDGGDTFEQIKAGATTTEFHAAAIVGGTLYAGSDHGVFRMKMTGERWNTASNGINNSTIYDIVHFDGKLYAASEDGYVSSDGGVSWNAAQDGGAINPFTILVPKGDYLFGGSSDGLYRRGRSGSWSRIAFPGTSDGLACYAILVSGNDIFAGIGPKVFRSSDNGATWKLANKGRSDGYPDVLAEHGGKLYAVAGLRLHVSTDRGETWVAPTADRLSNEIASLVVIDGVIYAGGTGVDKSTDGGVTWTGLTRDLPYYAKSITKLLAVGSDLYASTWAGVIRTSDQGKSWELISEGLTDTILTTIHLHEGVFYVGSQHGGVSRSDNLLAVPTGAKEPPAVVLGQNHPNPFSGSSVIGFHLVRGGAVSITLHDLLGREVATVLNGTLSAGDHTATVDGSLLSPGVYLYRLRAGGTGETRRMIVR